MPRGAVGGTLGYVGSSPVASTPTLVAGAAYRVESTTGPTIDIPDGTLVTDTVFLLVKTEGAITDPTGWTLVGTADPPGSTVTTYSNTGLTDTDTVTIPDNPVWIGGVSIVTVRDVGTITFNVSLSSAGVAPNTSDWDGTTIIEDNTLLFAAPVATFRTVMGVDSSMGVAADISSDPPGIGVFYAEVDAGPFGPTVFTLNAESSGLYVTELHLTA